MFHYLFICYRAWNSRLSPPFPLALHTPIHVQRTHHASQITSSPQDKHDYFHPPIVAQDDLLIISRNSPSTRGPFWQYRSQLDYGINTHCVSVSSPTSFPILHIPSHLPFVEPRIHNNNGFVPNIPASSPIISTVLICFRADYCLMAFATSGRHREGEEKAVSSYVSRSSYLRGTVPFLSNSSQLQTQRCRVRVRRDGVWKSAHAKGKLGGRGPHSGWVHVADQLRLIWVTG